MVTLYLYLKRSLKKKHSIQRHAVAEQSEKDEPLPKWAMNLAFISKTKMIIRLSTGEQLTPESFDSTFARELLPTKDQLEQMGESDNARIRNTPIMRPQDYVLNELQIPVAYDETYDPRAPDDAFVKEDGIRYVNTYTKTHPTPSENQEDIDMVGEKLRDHIAKLIVEPEYQKVLLDFLAYNVQSPGSKIRWAVLIQGGEGCGKGLLAKVMRTVMGEKHVMSVDPEVLSSPYNDWAYGHALTVLNEIHSKGMSRYAVENKLKEPIADDKVSLNEKFKGHRQINNRTNYIMFTNFHDALAISANSRRYFVLHSPLQRKKDILKLTRTGHFERMLKMVED